MKSIKVVNGRSASTGFRVVGFGRNVCLAGSVKRTLSGAEAGRVLGFGCNHT